MSTAQVEVSRSGGRRERNMADKQRRIFTAAAALFDKRGFEAVTTQEISDRADVAAGTVFRYAASKAELLLMVYNEEFRKAVEVGRQAAAAVSSPVGAAVALVDPVVAFGLAHPQNSLAYQRELLFGSPGQVYRTEGIGLVCAFEGAIAERLVETATTQAPGADADALRPGATRAARSVFAALSMLMAQPATGVRWGRDGVAELHEQITQIVLGYLAWVGTAEPHATAERES